MMDYTNHSPDLVALVGDWHGDTEWAVAAVDLLAEVGVPLVISVGDFGYWPHFTKGPSYLAALTARLEAHNMVLWWVDGNHEDHEELKRQPVAENGLRPITSRIFHIPRGFRWTWEGTTWMGLGGAVSVDQDVRVAGVDWFPSEKISKQDATYATRPGNVDVMVTHEGTVGASLLDARLSGPSMWDKDILVEANANRMRLTEVVEAVKPNFLFHGHHHINYSDKNGDTLVRGLSCNGSSMGDNITVVDTTGARCM